MSGYLKQIVRDNDLPSNTWDQVEYPCITRNCEYSQKMMFSACVGMKL